MAKGELAPPPAGIGIKLDKVDERIIHELVKNCRTPASVIASKARVRKEVVLYRIEKLVQNGVLASTYLAIGIKRLGYTAYNVLFRTQNLSREKEKELLNFLVSHPYISWVIGAVGRWDIILQVLSRSPESFDTVLNEIRHTFGHFLKEYQFFIIVEFHHFVHTYLKEVQEKRLRGDASFERELRATKTFEPVSLDRKDIDILTALSENARLSLTEIGRRTGLSSDAVSYRIKKLIEQGIIKHFGILRNKFLLGYQFYSLLLKINDNNPEKMKTFLEIARTDGRINIVTRQIGRYNYVLDIDCTSAMEFKNLLDKIKELFGDIIEDYEMTNQFHQYLFTYLPAGIIQDLKRDFASPV